MVEGKNNHYDVIIVGAGPGGLECANILSKAGKKILLLEKNSEIGPKICAGGLTTKSINFLKLPKDFGGRKYNNVIFKTRFNKITLDYGEEYIHVIDRKDLGQWQLKKLNNNVEVKVNAKVSKISENSVLVNETEIFFFSYLVGADGSNSIVRKFLKLPIKKLIVAFQYILDKDFPNILAQRDSGLFKYLYAWIFPQGEITSVGSGGYVPKMNISKVREDFYKWIKKEKIEISSGEFQSFAINCDFRGYKFGNVFLIGDAAGFASPLTGEGIYQALISGNEVANLILDSNYNPVRIKSVIKQRNLHIAVLRILMILGPLRIIFYELMALITKNKFLGKVVMNFLG